MPKSVANLVTALEQAGVKAAKAEREVRDLAIENDRLRKRLAAVESLGRLG